MSPRQAPISPLRMWFFFVRRPRAWNSASARAAWSLMVRNDDASRACAISPSGTGMSRKRPSLRTVPEKSRFSSSYETHSTVPGCSSAALSQPACHSQKQPDSTSPVRKRAVAKCWKSPLYSKPARSLAWWNIDTQASLGFRVTTTTFAPPQPAKPPLQGSRSTGACVLKARLGGAGSLSTSPSQAISSSTDFGFAMALALMPARFRQIVDSIQGACNMGYLTLDLSPPWRSVTTICCIQVVPHLG
mmetsp:Transcript_9932/g.31531  ORF Transcript_9932/g.31531 Transcript_9932/m.31531 type:complete len:246 (-) Transcript_9932:401-1138(-)